MKKVGILGAGQLGCMLASSLEKWGAEVTFFDPNPDSPGRLRTPHFICAAWDDLPELEKFFRQVDAVTYEFENVDTRYLSEVSARTQTPLLPSSDVLKVTQSRATEKSFLCQNEIPCAPFRVVENLQDLVYLQEEIASLALAHKTFTPLIAKTLRGGYDGKGQLRISHNDQSQWQKVAALLPCVVEECLVLQGEVSVIVGRTATGEAVSFPPFENQHSNQILDVTLFPVQSFPPEVCYNLEKIASLCAEKLRVVGLLTTEFFLSQRPSFLQGLQGWNGGLKAVGGVFFGVNEFAPRPHNSGHITRSACFVNQFDLHARILLGLGLPPRSHLEPVREGVFAMGNLLAQHWPAQAHGNSSLTFSEVSGPMAPLEVTLYGKTELKPGRKMGHLNVWAPTLHEAVRSIEQARQHHFATNGQLH
jgi:5-(carboxyamino)imidazole ribonucleotide synthase